jgi:hypothetical protein
VSSSVVVAAGGDQVGSTELAPVVPIADDRQAEELLERVLDERRLIALVAQGRRRTGAQPPSCSSGATRSAGHRCGDRRRSPSCPPSRTIRSPRSTCWRRSGGRGCSPTPKRRLNDPNPRQRRTAAESGRGAGTAGAKRDPGAPRRDPFSLVHPLTRPVTPEVAGSSPVAPRKNPCKVACCVVRLDAKSAPTTHNFLDATRKRPKTARYAVAGRRFQADSGRVQLTAKAAGDYTRRPEVTAAPPPMQVL